MANMKPAEAAKKLGISVKTLQRWDKDGVLVAQRLPTGRRTYTEESLKDLIPDENGIIIDRQPELIHAMIIKRGKKELLVAVGDVVSVYTDATDFEESFENCKVESLDETEIRFDYGDSVPWEYINSIEVIEKRKDEE